MADIKYTADMTQVLNAYQQLHTSLGTQVAQFKTATASMAEYNTKTGEWTTTVKGALTTGEQFVAKLKQINGVTQVTNLKTVAEDMKSLQAASGSFTNVMQAGLERLRTIFTGQILKQGINAMTEAIADGAREAIQLQVRISEIRTISQESNISFNQWSKSVRALSDEFGQSQTDVAAANYEIISNQVVNASEATAFLTKTLQFSQVTVSSAKDSLNLLSSAILGFRKSSSETDQVASALFKTIELGRIRASDIANNFGRIAPIANTLGISLEEVGASLAVLTRQGVTPQDAMTQLLNIMIKLIRPTDEMKTLLQSWGTPTGEAAISTFGFAGTLQKIAEFAKGSTGELSKLFNEIRGLRGATGLTLFQNIDDDLAKIKEAGQSYQNAIEIIKESSGKQLLIQLEQIKNFFISDIGGPVIDTINNVTKSFAQWTGVGTGLADIIKLLTNTLINSVKIITTVIGLWVLWQTTVVTTSSAIKAFTAVQTTWYVVQNTTTGGLLGGIRALIAYTGAANAATIATAALTFGVPLLIGALLTLKQVYSDNNAELQKYAANSDRLSEVQANLNKAQRGSTRGVNKGEAQTKEIIDNVKTTFNAVNQELAKQYQQADIQQKKFKESILQTSDAVKITFKGYVDSIRAVITDIQKKISEAESQIKASKDYVGALGKSIGEIIYGTQLQYGTLPQQLGFITDRLETIRSARAKLANDISTMDADQRRSALDNINKYNEDELKLIKERFDKQVELAKAANPNQQIAVNVRGLSDELIAAGQRQTDEQGRIQKSIGDTIAEYRKLSSEENKRLKAAEAAAQDFFKYQKAFSEGTEGNVKDFQKNGKFDQDVAQQRIKDSIRALVSTVGAAGVRDFLELQKIANGERLAMERDMVEQQTNIFRLGEANKTKLSIEGEQERVKQVLKNAGEVEKARNDLAAKFKNEISNKGGVFDNIIGNVGQLKASIDSFIPKDFMGLISDGFTKFRGTAVNLKSDLQALLEEVDRFRNTEVDINDPSAVNAQEKALETIRLKWQNITANAKQYLDAINKQRIDTGMKPVMDVLPGTENQPVPARVSTIVNDTKTQLRTLNDFYNSLQDKIVSLQELQTIPAAVLQNSTGALRDSLTGAVVDTGNATNVIKENFRTVGDSVGNVAEKVKAFADEIKKLQNININVTGSVTTNDLGGFPARHGSDNILGLFSKKEMIINADATERFRPILQAMNASVRPGMYDLGGPTNNVNIGDINLNTQISGNSDRDVRKFASQLRREVRRGTVKLT